MADVNPAAVPLETPLNTGTAWRRLGAALRRHPTAVIGAVVLVLMAAIAILAPWLGTTDPLAVSPIKRLKPPSAQYWFGTDMLGRDVYSRVIYGARVSLTVGLAVALVATGIGLAIGLVTGFVRWLDAIVMRVMDGLMSIPSVLIAIALIALTKASLENVIAAIAIAEIPRVVRLVRSLVLTLREQPSVEAAVAAGTPLPRILVRHILPNTVAPLLVQATYICASAMITEAILSFVGAGTLLVFPGVCLSLTVLAVNLLGDGMRDALDPRLARRL